MPKENRINLRLSEEEYEQLKAQAGNQAIATMCRDLLLSKAKISQRKVKKKRNAYTTADPALLIEINAIGKNLNQIARLGNAARKNNTLELWRLIEALELIHQDMKALIKIANARKNN